MKFCVLWGKQEQPNLRLMPMDDANFADSEEAAKEAGRRLLAPLKLTGLMPVGVLKIPENEIEAAITSDREQIEFKKADGTFDKNDPNADDLVEFIQLAP